MFAITRCRNLLAGFFPGQIDGVLQRTIVCRRFALVIVTMAIVVIALTIVVATPPGIAIARVHACINGRNCRDNDR